MEKDTKSKGENVIVADLSLPEGLVIKTIMENSEDTIYFKNLQSKFILNSKAHAIQFNETVRNMVGKDDYDYFPAEFARIAYEGEQEIIRTGKPVVGNIEKWDKKDGTTVWFSASKYPLYDLDGKIIGTWGTSRDITPLKLAERQLLSINLQLQEANQKLEGISIHDNLSGLFNQRHFYERLNIAKALESREKDQQSDGTFSIILLDVDHFKEINDSFGHNAGDDVIRFVSAKIKQSIRISDACFRHGGDEFSLLLPNTKLEAARFVSEKLRRTIQELDILLDERELHITVSMGVACSNETDLVERLVRIADERMYLSKNNGRNQVY
jgi:diguanylate cyclase (GGDEF)-like protein/PAS domain S-box-containing protein